MTQDVGAETEAGPLSDTDGTDGSEPGSTAPEVSENSCYVDTQSDGQSDTPGRYWETQAEEPAIEKPTETFAPSNWIKTVTPEMLRIAQLKDDAVGYFLQLIEDEKKRPAYASLEGPSLRWKQSLWMQWGNLLMRKGILFIF